MSSPALKKIPVEQVRLGMHLHELCGAWLDHPFWKTKFVLHDAVDLEKLQRSGVRECWIDVSKGFDVACDAAEPALPAQKGHVAVAALDVDAATDLARAAQVAPLAQVPFNEELQRAADLCNQARAAVISLFSEARMGRVAFSKECEELVHGISDSVMRNSTTMVSLARLKSHDDYTYMHSVAVAALMAALARQLQLDPDEIRLAAKAGLLHDMGKAVMPREILNKPGKLTDDEFTVIRTHPERGHALLMTGEAFHDVVLDVCLHHHEKIDGSGYPHRLPGEKISLFAKMGAVCDVYDAITSNRPYKRGWDPAESVARMAGWATGHFDP
ncbi:MAG: HD-GYP domain-containing protein, partial [Burkholderiaceae bacterium]|nr:HD-GYP domain-containing protein [Burkholderiaceae bacterium]